MELLHLSCLVFTIKFNKNTAGQQLSIKEIQPRYINHIYGLGWDKTALSCSRSLCSLPPTDQGFYKHRLDYFLRTHSTSHNDMQMMHLYLVHLDRKIRLMFWRNCCKHFGFGRTLGLLVIHHKSLLSGKLWKHLALRYKTKCRCLSRCKYRICTKNFNFKN